MSALFLGAGPLFSSTVTNDSFFQTLFGTDAQMATHALYTCAPCKSIAQTLLGPEVQANGDFWFRAAVSEDIGVDWGYEVHQDSFNYGTPPEFLEEQTPAGAICQVQSLADNCFRWSRSNWQSAGAFTLDPAGERRCE